MTLDHDAPPGPPTRAAARRGGIVFGLAIAFALIVHLPALFTPFTIDDFAHMAMADGDYPSSHDIPLGLYDFVDDFNRQALMDRGILPFWTHPKLVCRFFRPLSSLILYADYRFFGRHAFLGHLHSLAWWAAASVGVYALFRRTLPRRVAGMGAMVFAVAPCHTIPLAWLANREALVSTALGVAALVAYSSWRLERRARDALASAVLFSLAMLAGEYSICIGGYVAAMEITMRRESIARRLAGAMTFLVPTVAYLAVRRALHYGARAGGMYHDPFWNFAGFARGLPHRLGALLCMGWLGLDELLLIFASVWTVAALVAVGAALLAVPVARAFRALEGPTRQAATWLLLGSFFSLAPMLAVEPSARLLGIAVIGVSAVVALALDRAWFPPTPEPRRGVPELAGWLALGLAFVHLVRAPVTSVLTTRVTSDVARAIARRMSWAREHAAGKSTLVVLRADFLTTAIFAPCMLGDAGAVRWRVLSYEAGRVLLLRTSDRSLELVASPRPIFPMGPRQVFRDFDHSLHAGDTVDVEGMKATVLQLDKDEMPRRVRFDFDRSLDDPSFLWLKETDDGFEEQPMPRIGYGEPISPESAARKAEMAKEKEKKEEREKAMEKERERKAPHR